MRKLTRILTAGLTAVMLFASLAFSASAASKFTDVSAKDETLTKAVALLEGLGVTKGTSEDTFGTNDPVTRQQMAAFIYRLMNRGKSVEGGENTTTFEDLYDDTYFSYVSWAHGMGVIKGLNATEFNPDGTIILQDAYTMIIRALGYEKAGDMAYPFDYIEVAESDGVDLGEGLPSSVSYEKELTRGNVAILLYNAFYAEMGEAEEKEVARKIGDEEKAKWVLELKTVYPKLCEKVYEVIEGEFQVRETTHYAFNNSKDATTYAATEDSYGDGTMLLVAVEEDETAQSFYTNMEELGLTGDADSYIMSNISVYYTYDKEDKQVDKIFVATPLIEKVTTNSASITRVSAEKKNKDYEHFYNADTSYPRADGKMQAGGKTLYFFDAPYNFLSPSYTGCTTDEDKYAVRNADNTKLINLQCTDINKGLYSYYLEDVTFASKDGYGTDYERNFIKTFYLVRQGGIYSMELFDPDGDGHYEYMWYKPATLGRIDMDDEYTFHTIDEHKENKPVIAASKNTAISPANIPMIYANGADIDGTKGATFRDGDFVAAYLNADANYIYLYGVGSAKKGTITKVDGSTGTLTLGGSQNFETPYTQIYVENYYLSSYKDYNAGHGVQFGGLLSTSNLNKEITVYYYSHARNNMFYYELGEAASTYTGEELLIPLEAQTQLSRDENNNKLHYLKVWVNGAEKYVPVDPEACYPIPEKQIDGTFIFNNVVTEPNGDEYDVYVGKLCTYSVDKEGVYTIHSLLHGEDEDGECDHIELSFNAEDDSFFNTKETTQSATDLTSTRVKLTKQTSKYYTLTDTNDWSMIGTYGTGSSDDYWFDEADVSGATIIIREITVEDGEEENEFHIYKGTEFPGTLDSILENVQYIYENDGDSTKRAKLVLLYGEVNGELEFASASSTKKTDWRIVKSATPIKVADKEFRMSYDLYNLNTGKVEEGVLGVTSKSTASALGTVDTFDAGDVVKLNNIGQVNDKKDADGTINAVTNKNLVFVSDVDLDSMILEIALVNDDDDDHFTDEKDGNFYTYYQISDNVVITMLKLEDKDDISSADISTLTLDDLAAAKSDLKAYNNKIEDKNGKLTTKYGEFVKAYVTFNNPKNSSDDYPTIDTITVIVNDNEPEEYLKIK